MKLVIHPIQDQQREVDVTHRLVSAIAQELWRLYGGNEQLNWVEAELHLQRIVGEVRAEARETEVVPVAPSPTEDTQQMPGVWPAHCDDDERSAPSQRTRRRVRPDRRDVGVRGALASGQTRSKETKNNRAVTAVAS